ncbi:hypothetical protein [Clostridium uliginosum]|uniref:Uncharacterized protein n=1 Tax=Clostridium uliginosum TaxID=119641 RepID=A0A1I1Q1J2_9CLOT|nr:hypothetical protein [Clostridium uliginosum]SFD15812.1 hypothetical protein SAMN05421842_12253 [Clostridium uliginosum]
MNTVPYNEYLLVMPSGRAKGFNDLDLIKAYINRYYEKIIDHEIDKDDYNDATEIGAEEPRRNICTQLGVEQGKCEVYSIDSFIDTLREELIFDVEKEELITKLFEENIDFNVYDYGLDIILADVDVIDVMEQYGEPD